MLMASKLSGSSSGCGSVPTSARKWSLARNLLDHLRAGIHAGDLPALTMHSIQKCSSPAAEIQQAAPADQMRPAVLLRMIRLPKRRLAEAPRCAGDVAGRQAASAIRLVVHIKTANSVGARPRICVREAAVEATNHIAANPLVTELGDVLHRDRAFAAAEQAARLFPDDGTRPCAGGRNGP